MALSSAEIGVVRQAVGSAPINRDIATFLEPCLSVMLGTAPGSAASTPGFQAQLEIMSDTKCSLINSFTEDQTPGYFIVLPF